MKEHVRFLCIISIFFTIFQQFTLLSTAEERYAPHIVEVEIGISSDRYKKLTTSAEKTEYDVWVQADGAGYLPATINIRGSSSRVLGLQTSARRVPLELSFEDASCFPALQNKKVKLINSLTPYRLLAEYLSLDLFASFGIPTPAHTFAFLRFNDVDFGLYLAVEDINKGFLRKQYGVKEVSAAFKATNNEEKAAQYIDSRWFGHLFQKVDGDAALLDRLFAALEAGKGYEQYINVDEWLRYFACVSVIGGDASIFTEQNNFALYDNGGKFDLIPWDLSEGFSGRETPNGINRYYVDDMSENPNPLFDLFMRNADYKSQYLAYVRQAADSFLRPEVLDAHYTALLEAIEPYLKRDGSIYLNPENAAEELRKESDSSMLSLLYTLHGSYANLCAQLDGEESTFFVHPAYREYYATPFEKIPSMLEVLEPKTDASLPRRIQAGYAPWLEQAGVAPVRARSAVERYGLPLICAVAAGTILFFFLRKQKKERGNEWAAISLRQRVRHSVSEHRLMLCLLLFLFLYEFFFVRAFEPWMVGSYPYMLHALDYSIGFCSRILPGAIANLLFRELTVFKVTVLETVLLLLFFVSLCWFLEKLYLCMPAGDRQAVLLLILFFVTGPCSFGIYVKEIGMLDAWWLYCTVLVFFLLLKKKYSPLIVGFAFIYNLIYFSSVLCFLPFLVVILLYEAAVTVNRKEKRRNYMIAGAFALASIGCSFFFINLGPEAVKVTPEELFSLLKARGVEGTFDEELRSMLYSVAPEDYHFPTELQSGFLAQILVRLKLHLSLFLENDKDKYLDILGALLLVSPMLILMQSVFGYRCKSSKDRMQRFIFFCMIMLFPFIVVSTLFVSTDTIKWLSHGFTLTFACFLVVLYHEPQLMKEKVKPWLQRVPAPVWVCYFAVYAVTVYHPYS